MWDRKRFTSDLSPEEWEQRRRGMTHPHPAYWVGLAMLLLMSTAVLLLNGFNPNGTRDMQFYVGSSVLLVVWILAINALISRWRLKRKNKKP